MRKLAIPIEKSQVSSYVTLSAGLATVIPTSDSSFQEMIAAADKALYQAKATGRDRFVFSTEQTENLEEKQIATLAKLFVCDNSFLRKSLWLFRQKLQQTMNKNQQLMKQVQQAIEQNQQNREKRRQLMGA
ncbi:diguanylate cyclase domain-containing protein [Nostoc sp.]|uniref:diguanylate cyclase domain-containing protein n=1 Tax=Nostoc sp. TaxID=1180 RepID=UPI002FF4751D